jgi:putative ABC transport system permease protein
VVCQTALTLVCLAATGLVVKSFLNVLHVEPGFRADQILTVDISLSPTRFRTPERAVFVRSVLERLQTIPGVASAGFINKPPLSGISMNSLLVLEGTEEAQIPFAQRPQGDVRSVDAGYFRTFGIPLLQGTMFDETQRRPVAVVSAAIASRAWPGQNPVGKRFRLTVQPNTLLEVVGVAGNVRNMGLEGDVSPTVYLPFWQYSMSGATFAVRTAPDAALPTAAVRAVLSETSHDVPIDRVRTMRSVVGDSVATRSFQATILTVFGMIAVALAGIGIFGVMSYAVAQRTKELGIRLALGATAASLQRLIVGHTLRLVAAGLAVGLPLAVATGFALRGMLFGVQPQDARVLVASSAVLIFLAILAGWIPAHRVARIDPVATLRAE